MSERKIIRDKVVKMMDEEMSFYETACKEGDEEISSSPMVYTRLQMLLAFIDDDKNFNNNSENK